jgi:hypothetical protein
VILNTVGDRAIDPKPTLKYFPMNKVKKAKPTLGKESYHIKKELMDDSTYDSNFFN